MRTAKQMIAAKKGALYVWCNSRLNYPKNLAAYLHRSDLVILSPHMLTRERLQGYEFSEVVYDHAVRPSDVSDATANFVLTRIKPLKVPD